MPIEVLSVKSPRETIFPIHEIIEISIREK